MGSGQSAKVILRFVVVLILGCAATVSAQAQSNPNSVTLTLDGGTGDLVPGAATVPSFHMNFLLDDARRLGDAPIGSTRDLEISMTAPNTPVFRFLFSPRAQFGIGYDPISGASRGYAGLTWNLFTGNSLYGNLGLASSFDPGGFGGVEAHRLDVAPLMFHGAVEFGYRIDQRNSVSLAIDQGVAPPAHGAGTESVDNFMLRYGTKF